MTDVIVTAVESLLVEEAPDLVVVGEQAPPDLIVDRQDGTVIRSDLSTETIAIVTVGPQGPPGEGGSGEEEVPYSKRVDFVGETTIYRGEAVPGTAESAASWRVRRLTLGPGDDVTEEWAGGSAAFDKIWANRASYSYS